MPSCKVYMGPRPTSGVSVAAPHTALTGAAGTANKNVQPRPANVALTGVARSVSSTTQYDATFTGDPTGVSDVTTALRTFFAANSGTIGLQRHVAIPAGTYRVSRQSDGVAVRVNGWEYCTVDFLGGAQFVMDPGASLRSGSDASVTFGSKVVTSASAAFTTAADANTSTGERVMVIAGIPYSIGTVQSTTQMTMPSPTLFAYLGTTGTNKSWYIREQAAHGIFRIEDFTGIVLNDPKITGTALHSAGGETAGYFFVDNDQYEAAISLLSGQGTNAAGLRNGTCTINRLVARYCSGDAVDISGNRPVPAGAYYGPVASINTLDSQYMGRDHMSLKGGTVTVTGGTVAHSGLHGFNAEPNDGDDAAACIMTINGANISTYGDLNVETGQNAVVAGGSHDGTKISVTVTNTTADVLQIYVRDCATTVVTNNTSTAASRVLAGNGETARSRSYYETVTSRTFSNNSANMTQVAGHP